MKVSVNLSFLEAKAVDGALAIAGTSLDKVFPEMENLRIDKEDGVVSVFTTRKEIGMDTCISVHFRPKCVVKTITLVAAVCASMKTLHGAVKNARSKFKEMFSKKETEHKKTVGPWKIIEVHVERGVK